jgi:DNA-nicking Smr family endonuclease
MDFGDILGEWDKKQKESAHVGANKGSQDSHKKANAPTPEEKEAAHQGYTSEQVMVQASKERIDPMEMWLRRYGTVDKDAAAESYAEQTRMQSREYLRELKPESRIDLHGLTRDEAWEKLNEFVGDCVRRGFVKILIVHGKGNHSTGSDPVLGAMVRTFIEQDARLGSLGHPDKIHGGTGATWVIIKSNAVSKE